MEETDVRFLEEQWRRLINEYREARTEARMRRLSREQIQAIDDKHAFLVDTAYARLKYAEARDAWRRN